MLLCYYRTKLHFGRARGRAGRVGVAECEGADKRGQDGEGGHSITMDTEQG